MSAGCQRHQSARGSTAQKSLRYQGTRRRSTARTCSTNGYADRPNSAGAGSGAKAARSASTASREAAGSAGSPAISGAGLARTGVRLASKSESSTYAQVFNRWWKEQQVAGSMRLVTRESDEVEANPLERLPDPRPGPDIVTVTRHEASRMMRQRVVGAASRRRRQATRAAITGHVATQRIGSRGCVILEAATIQHVRDQLLAVELATPEEIETHFTNLTSGDLHLINGPR